MGQYNAAGGGPTMNSSGFALKGETGSRRIELECEHQSGVLYVVPSEASWVCGEEMLHVHSLAGFLRELTDLDDPNVQAAMQRWGLYYRPRALAEKDEAAG